MAGPMALVIYFYFSYLWTHLLCNPHDICIYLHKKSNLSKKTMSVFALSGQNKYHTYVNTCIDPLVDAEARLWVVMQGVIANMEPPWRLYVNFDL